MADNTIFTAHPVTVDVLVVGAGGAGMAAAASAAEASPDADVLVVQKIERLGGSTTMAVGSFAAGGTDQQATIGISDHPDFHFHDLDKFLEKYERGAGRTFYFDYRGDIYEKEDRSLRRILVDNAAETLAWLEAIGCQFAGPFPDPPHRVPRVHTIVPGTEAYPRIFGAYFDEMGVDVVFNHQVVDLLTEGNAVTGAVVQSSESSETVDIHVRSGVILATGDYVNNQRLRAEFTSDADAPPVNEHNTGDGFLLAKEVGAGWVNMDIQRLTLRFGEPLWLTPDIPGLVDEGAIVINMNGHRFIDETVDYDQLFTSTLMQPEESLYVLFGEQTANRFTKWPRWISSWPGTAWGYLDQYRDTDVLLVSESPDRIANAIGADVTELTKTIDRFTAAVTGDRIDNFGRTEFGAPIDGNLHVLGPIRPYATITEGGLTVDESMQVLDSTGSPIPGLFAAGSVAGGHHLVGHGHHHSWIFTSGRIAGRSVSN